MQRAVADFEGEPLMAVLPGVALDELWDVVGAGERALLAMSAMVAVVSLAGLVAVVLAGLNERRRELAVLRAVGAAPRHVLLMLAAEGAHGHAARRGCWAWSRWRRPWWRWRRGCNRAMASR